MKNIFEKGLIIYSAAMLAGIVTATNVLANYADPTNNNVKSVSYTANGKTDKKTALLFQQLLKNNPNLQIEAQVIKRPLTQANQNQKVTASNNVLVGSPTPARNKVKSVSYTAHGKTDRKTALLFQQLLKNNRNLQIQTQVIKRSVPSAKRNLVVSVNYTVTGKTNMNTVRKLVKLFKNNKEVEIIAKANINASTSRQQNIQYGHNNWKYNTFPIQQPFYYKGYPPVYIQGNTMWYPVQVNTQAYPQNNTVSNISTPKSLAVAGM
jgi:GrpB-like predicted nucleotidyltransferase (UPF0157 family)